MVDPENSWSRIDRMEQDGLLSAEQAAGLRDGIKPLQAKTPERRRSRRSIGWILSGVAISTAAIVVILLVSSGDGPVPVQDVSIALNEPGGVGAMNAAASKIIALAILLIVPLVGWVWMHNSLVAKEEDVFEAWAQVESNYQRRADLIPTLVESVSRYVRHESETLSAITTERAESAKQLSTAIDQLISAQQAAANADSERVVEDEDKLTQLFTRQNAVGRSVTNLLAVAESYPELRSADQFLELQAQLEGTENRINVARMRFNDAASVFNSTMRKLPWNLVASVGNFQRKAYFRSEKEARDAPELGFR